MHKNLYAVAALSLICFQGLYAGRDRLKEQADAAKAVYLLSLIQAQQPLPASYGTYPQVIVQQPTVQESISMGDALCASCIGFWTCCCAPCICCVGCCAVACAKK